MTVQEAQKVIEELRAAGKAEGKPDDEINKEIAGSFYLLFQKGQLDINALESLVNLLGYHLSDDFKAMDPEQQKTEGYEEVSGAEAPETEEQPAPEEANQEEDEEKKAMNLFAGKKDQGEEEVEEKETTTEENDDDEEKKAMNLFGR